MSKDDESWEEILHCTFDTPPRETPDSKDDPWVYEKKWLEKPKFQTKLCQDDEKSGDKKSPITESESGFRPDDLENTLGKFLNWKGEKDRLNPYKTKGNCYKWIIYHVTKGKYRISPRGIMRVYTGEPGIHNIIHNKTKWAKLPQCWKESNLCAIADECNVIHEALKAVVYRRGGTRALDRVTRINLEKMPEFVPSAQHRNILHKTCKWVRVGKNLPACQGGGMSKPGRPMRNPHLAVDTILKEYNRFLPKIPTMI